MSCVILALDMGCGYGSTSYTFLCINNNRLQLYKHTESTFILIFLILKLKCVQQVKTEKSRNSRLKIELRGVTAISWAKSISPTTLHHAQTFSVMNSLQLNLWAILRQVCVQVLIVSSIFILFGFAGVEFQEDEHFLCQQRQWLGAISEGNISSSIMTLFFSIQF